MLGHLKDDVRMVGAVRFGLYPQHFFIEKIKVLGAQAVEVALYVFEKFEEREQQGKVRLVLLSKGIFQGNQALLDIAWCLGAQLPGDVEELGHHFAFQLGYMRGMFQAVEYRAAQAKEG